MNADCHYLVDPELTTMLDMWPTRTFSMETLADLRATPRIVTVECDPSARAVNMAVHRARGSGDAPDVALRVYTPPSRTSLAGCVVHMHGGGYVCGESAHAEPWHRKITAELNCVFVSVDYRLAPETCFPGNIEDCYAALSWVYDHADEIGIDRRRVGVMGESAGGGLAAALALLARDRGEFQIAFQHLIYPMLDDRTCVAEDAHCYTGDFYWTPSNNYFGWSSLLGQAPGARSISPYAAPARASELALSAPAFISTGALDLFLEEDLDYARRLTRAGVPVELHVYPGAFHGFDLHPNARVAQAARRDNLAALRRFLSIPSDLKSPTMDTRRNGDRK